MATERPPVSGVQGLRPRLIAQWGVAVAAARRGYEAQLRRPLRILFAVAAVIAAALLLARIGGLPLMLSPGATASLVAALAWFYIVYEALGLAFRSESIGAYLRSHRIELAVAGVLLLRMLEREDLIAWLSGDGVTAEDAALTITLLTNAAVAIQAALHAFRRASASGILRLNPAAALVSSFLLLILLGWGLLSLPAATRIPVAPIDHLFVAVSAVCVTGLSPLDISIAYSRTGQWFILFLIQIGGLGLMTLTSFFAYFFAGRVSVQHAIFMRELLSEESVSQVRSLLGAIALFTFGIELLGALWLYWHSAGLAGLAPADRWFHALFHSVSAFCNAGFALYSTNLSEIMPRSPAYISGVAALIFFGGFGFPFVNELVQRLRGARRRASVALRAGLTLHFALLLIGAALLLLIESRGVLKNLNAQESFLHALFYTISARTAGFNALAIESLSAATVLFTMALMWIGANPGGTAGGVKTTTFAIGFAYVIQRLLGRDRLDLFGRTVTEQSVFRAVSGMLLSMLWILAALFLLTLSEDAPFLDLAFEVVSAFGTVGLSRGVTADLSDFGKATICVVMLAGRVGALTAFVALLPRSGPPRYRYPAEYVMTG